VGGNHGTTVVNRSKVVRQGGLDGGKVILGRDVMVEDLASGK